MASDKTRAPFKEILRKTVFAGRLLSEYKMRGMYSRKVFQDAQ